MSGAAPNLARAALAKYGQPAQLFVACEELAELIVAISHYQRGRAGALLELCTEIADAELMLEQLREVVRQAGCEDWLDASRKIQRSKLLARMDACVEEPQP